MSMFTTSVVYLAAFIHTYMHEICIGISAVLLALLGPHINASIRKLVKKCNLFIRYAVFVLVCTAGYTFLAQIIYQGVKHLLRSCSDPLMVVVTIVLYLILAWIAKENKAI